MKKNIAIFAGIVFTFVACFGMAQATQTFSEDIFVPSLKVGSQEVGGVTFFNGTIVNNTTDANDADQPVTFGDNVRIDGTIFRTEEGGDNPIKLGDSIRPATDNAYDLGTSTHAFKDGYFDGALTVDSINANSYSGFELADLAGQLTGAITTSMLADEAVTNDKLAEDAVGRYNIAGPNGTNLPIAYGYVNTAGTVVSGTDGITCTKSLDYDIAIADETLSTDSHIILVTPTTANRFVSVNDIVGNFRVSFNDEDGNPWQSSGFQFVIYKLN